MPPPFLRSEPNQVSPQTEADPSGRHRSRGRGTCRGHRVPPGRRIHIPTVKILTLFQEPGGNSQGGGEVLVPLRGNFIERCPLGISGHPPPRGSGRRCTQGRVLPEDSDLLLLPQGGRCKGNCRTWGDADHTVLQQPGPREAVCGAEPGAGEDSCPPHPGSPLC